MTELKSTTIVPIAFYCLVVMGAKSCIYILFSVVNVIINNTTILTSNDFKDWLPFASFAIFGIGFIAVSIGIVNLDKLSWKILFFGLVIGILGAAVIIITFLILLLFNADFILTYVHTNQVTSALWLPLLLAFLSGIIILYYLVHKDVVSSFGGMDELLPPF